MGTATATIFLKIICLLFSLQSRDVKTIEKDEIEKLKGLKVLVVNALRIEEHKTHFNLAEALHFIELIKPEKTYLTHISHVFGFHEAIQKSLPENVFLAYDNLEITL
jgi:phosphoribosyl 1,2-cyclic phosphate phosphodiesterase